MAGAGVSVTWLVEASDGLYYVGAPTSGFDLQSVSPGLYLASGSDTSGVSFSWAGVDFTVGGPYFLQSVEGWAAPPDASAEDIPLAGRHGVMMTPMGRRHRIVTVEGVCVDEATRDGLFRYLRDCMSAGFGDGQGSSPLAGWLAGEVLTADAQLQRFAPLTEQARWGRGVFPFRVRWRCPDPLLYGSWSVFTAGIEAPTAGLTYPVSYPVSYPDQAPSGQVSVFNAGNALAPATVTLLGPLGNRPGVACVSSGAQIRYEYPLAAGDSLVVDTAQGAMFLNGEFRSPSTSSSLFDELRVPVGSSTWQSLGDPTGSGAQVSVAFRSAFW